jgi:outer membrane protein TolC
MTLDDALAYARLHHPRMQASRAQLEASRARAEVPHALWMPRVGASAQLFGATTNNTTATVIGSPDVVLPRIGGTRARDPSSASLAPSISSLAALGVNQELYDFGRIDALEAAADAAVDVERYRTDDTWLDIELGVREAYFAVRAARAVQKAAEDAYTRALAHRDMARAWVDRGLRPRIELERAEADLARFDVGRVRARGDLESAKAAFAEAVGLDNAQLDAADQPAALAPLPELGEALREAGARAPLILAVEAQVKAQEARTRVIEAEELPDIQITGSLSGRAGGADPTSGDPAGLVGVVPMVPNWDVGVVFNWPIYDAAVAANQRASQRTEEALRAQADAIRQRQVAAIQQAWMAVDIAEKALPALQRALGAAKSNYAQADARFRAGLTTSVELADAEALRTDAEIQLAIGEFQIGRARARFAREAAEGSP